MAIQGLLLEGQRRSPWSQPLDLLQVPAVGLEEGTGGAMETFPGLRATQVATES